MKKTHITLCNEKSIIMKKTHFALCNVKLIIENLQTISLFFFVDYCVRYLSILFNHIPLISMSFID